MVDELENAGWGQVFLVTDSESREIANIRSLRLTCRAGSLVMGKLITQLLLVRRRIVTMTNFSVCREHTGAPVSKF